MIVDTEAVGRYLMENEVPDPAVVQDGTNEKHMELEVSKKKGGKEKAVCRVDDWKKRPWTGQKELEVLWFDDLDHGEVFDEKAARRRLVDVIVEYSKSISEI